MIKETHKIWERSDVGVTATCVRVPVMRTHAESINLEFEQAMSEQEVSPAVLPDSKSRYIVRSRHDSHLRVRASDAHACGEHNPQAGHVRAGGKSCCASRQQVNTGSGLGMTATCVCVPVMRTLAESMNLKQALSEQEVGCLMRLVSWLQSVPSARAQASCGHLCLAMHCKPASTTTRSCCARQAAP